jgi:hypothetical protein
MAEADALRDGKCAAADTTARRRRGLNTALEYAVDLGEIIENPLKHIKQKKIARDDTVDHRSVVNPIQARELLTAVSYVGRLEPRTRSSSGCLLCNALLRRHPTR